MTQTVDLAVLGGGASGMMAALSALREARAPLRVTVLEKQDRVGRKLAATGNGRCNLTNAHAGPQNYHTSGDIAFLDEAMNAFPPEEVMDIFHELGLIPVERDEGRVYPLSDQAASVVDVLRFSLAECGAQIRCGCLARTVARTAEGFRIACGEDELIARRVVLAAGGEAAPRLGGCADGYRIARALGHTVLPRFPALTALKTETEPLRALKGCKFQGEIALRIDGREIRRERGEILFTDYGLSGIAAMQLSAWAARAEGRRVEAELRFLPETPDALTEELKARQNALCSRPLEDFLTGMLNKRIAQTLLKQCTDEPLASPAAALKSEELRALAGRLHAWRLRVTGVQGFDQAQVTSGGVSTREVDPRTMQSRRCPGLYLCGEVLDVDGDCGGYNLQWAWASGLLAGASAARSLRENTASGKRSTHASNQQHQGAARL